MRPLWHIIASSLLGLLIFYFSRSLVAALIALLAGVFIDLDHLIDFWSLKPPRPFSVGDFFHSEKFNEQKKYLFIFLHGYEWLLLLLFLSYLYHWPLFLVALLLSLSLHLLLDTINNLIIDKNTHPLSYFFLFRILTGFRKIK